ncbi:MAG: hypothetical protein PHX88_10005, partial [Methanoculleus horonobensis]|nr:hypothetical protein [Methanoculleus horonobensis]
MGINSAFSSWLRGAQSTVSSGIRAATTLGSALQTQTMTAISAAQRAATQPFQQQTRSQAPGPRVSSPAPYTARTLTPTDLIGGAARTIQSGFQGAQEAAQQIVRSHAPIVQGLQRDAGRAIQALPRAAANAPAAIQGGTAQILRGHVPITQAAQRDASAAIRSIPGALAGSGRAIQSGTAQILQAHAPIARGIQRDLGGAIRSVGGAGAPRQAPSRVVGSHSPTPGPSAPGRTPTPAQASPASLTPLQRQTQYVRGVERYQNAPGHTTIPKLQAQHKYAVEQYGIDPELRRYEQKLAAYNAQLAAYGRGGDRGPGRQETADRLRNMQQSLEGQRTSIMSRKNQELAGIRALEANIKMLGTPLQVEYQRLKAEEQALTAAAAPPQTTSGSGGGSGGRGVSTPQTGSLASLGVFGFAEQQKRAADAELRKIGGEGKPPSLPAWTPVQDTFFQGLYSHPVLKTVQMGPAGLAGEMAASHLVNRNLAQERAEVMTGFVRGEYEGLREDPKTAIGSFALGLVVPGVGKAVPWVGRTAAKVVGPKVAAAAAPYLPKIGKAAGVGLAGLYGGSVGVRLIEPDEQGFSPTAPLIAERAGRITSTEILPAAAGWGLASRGAGPLLQSATRTLKKAGTTLKNAGRPSRSGVQSVTRPQAPEWTRTLDLSSPGPDRVVRTPQTLLLPERAGPVRGAPASTLGSRSLPAPSVRTGSPSSPWGSYDNYYQTRLSDLLAERGLRPDAPMVPDEIIQAARNYAGTRVRIDTEVNAALQSGTPYSGIRRGSHGRGPSTPPKTGNAYIDTAVSRSTARRSGGPSVVEPSPWDSYDYHYQKRLGELLAERGISPGSPVLPDDAVQAARAYAGNQVLIETEVTAAMRAGGPVKGSRKAPSKGSQDPPKTGNVRIDAATARAARQKGSKVLEPSPWDSYDYHYQKRLGELLAERGISPGSPVLPDDAVQAARAYAGNQVLIETEV